MSLNILLRRVDLVKPTIASSSRALSTIVDATSSSTASSTSAIDASSSASGSTAPAVSSQAHLRLSLPQTAAPTPYHPFVHLPLLSFFPKPSDSLAAPIEAQLVPLPSHLFNTPTRPTLLHRLVISHLASLRTGNASTKNRSEVNYSGHKLRPQKGTGKARLGSRGSPMLRGGGRAFGPRTKGPDGWKRKVNRKEEVLGLRVALSEKWRKGDLVVVEKVGMETVHTRTLSERMGSRGWLDSLVLLSDNSLEIVEAAARERFVRSSGNLSDVAVLSGVGELGVWDIVKRRKCIVELEALEGLIGRLDPEWEDCEEEEDDEDFDFEVLDEELESNV